MTGARISISGDLSPIARYMGQVRKTLEDPKDMFSDIGSELQSSTQERLNAGRTPSGAAQTPVRRGGTPLVNTGINLRDSITFLASGSGVEVGSNFVAAAIHQLGGQAGRNKATKIDARPYLGISDQDSDVIEGVIESYLEATA